MDRWTLSENCMMFLFETSGATFINKVNCDSDEDDEDDEDDDGGGGGGGGDDDDNDTLSILMCGLPGKCELILLVPCNLSIKISRPLWQLSLFSSFWYYDNRCNSVLSDALVTQKIRKSATIFWS